MFRQLLSILFILAFAVHTFQQNLIVGSYYINNAVYAKNCENKAKPSLACKGKCQMMKKLQEEGKVVKLNNETMALYKDEHGSLHAVNPTCTHMKCSVAWNAAEKSWDCPCHGARYSIEGDVLNGPADANLELIELRSLLEKED